MSNHKLLPLWPVFMGKIKSVYADAKSPEDTDEQAQSYRGAIATQEFVVKRQRECAERNDRKHSKRALDPKQLAVE